MTGAARRLFDVKAAGEYLGVSAWTVRDWIAAGRIPTVELPSIPAREGDRPRSSFRRILIDRADLDAFIDNCQKVTR